MEIINDFEQNLHSLLSRYQALQQQVAELQQENAAQRQEILRSHSELASLQQQFKHLQEASAMVGSAESREAAKKHLTQLIAQIDRALEVLKQ